MKNQAVYILMVRLHNLAMLSEEEKELEKAEFP